MGNLFDRIRRAFESVRPTAVCHQVAQLSVSRSVREPAADAPTNILGPISLLDATVRCVKRLAIA